MANELDGVIDTQARIRDEVLEVMGSKKQSKKHMNPAKKPLNPEIGLIVKDEAEQKVSVVLTNVSTDIEDKVISFLTKFRFDLDFSYLDGQGDGDSCLVITTCIGTIIGDFLSKLAIQNKIKYVFEFDPDNAEV